MIFPKPNRSVHLFGDALGAREQVGRVLLRDEDAERSHRVGVDGEIAVQRALAQLRQQRRGGEEAKERGSFRG